MISQEQRRLEREQARELRLILNRAFPDEVMSTIGGDIASTSESEDIQGYDVKVGQASFGVRVLTDLDWAGKSAMTYNVCTPFKLCSWSIGRNRYDVVAYQKSDGSYIDIYLIDSHKLKKYVKKHLPADAKQYLKKAEENAKKNIANKMENRTEGMSDGIWLKTVKEGQKRVFMCISPKVLHDSGAVIAYALETKVCLK